MSRKQQNSQELFLQRALCEHERAIIGYVYGILFDLERSKDVAQDAFLKLSQQPQKKIKEKTLRAWLITVARNKAYDILRKDQRLVFQEEERIREYVENSAETPDQELEREERNQLLRCAVAELPENLKEVVELRFLHDLSYKEIATTTGLSVSNVGFLLHSAIRKLRQYLTNNREIIA